MNAATDCIFDEIARFLAGQPDIRLVMVFGSLATDRAGRDSDLDIARLGHQPPDAERRMQLIEKLTDLCGCPIDLVDLMTAPRAFPWRAVL